MDIPAGARLTDFSATYNQNTIPIRLLADSVLEGGAWGRVVIEEGALLLLLKDSAKPKKLSTKISGVIPPGKLFRVASGENAVRFHLEYYLPPKLSEGAELAGLLGRG